MASNETEKIDHSIQLINGAINADSQFCDLSELLQLNKHDQTSLSGLHDSDYPNQYATFHNLQKEITRIRKVPLPPELSEQFTHMQCNCMMGLFAEVSRAWLVVDSNIFVWNFEDGSDLAYFDGLNETILSVCLVKVKPGVFQPHITYLLCLTTPLDIVLLGVSFSRPFDASMNYSDVHTAGEMHLMPEPLFSLPTDNTNFTHVVGSHNGRIFMAGKDACLYELYYQARDGWFGRKCRKINHSSSKLSAVIPSFLSFSFVDDEHLVKLAVDDSRGILYSLSNKGMIQVYDLGSDCSGMRRVAAMSPATIQRTAALVAKTIDSSNFTNICHISPITTRDSTNIQLMAVTEAGVRLYFSVLPFGSLSARPSMISLVHVRIPPRLTDRDIPVKPSNTHKVLSKQGTVLLCCSESDDRDCLWVISPDTFPFTKQLMETFETCHLDGHTWDLAELTTSNTNHQYLQPPLVVRQHAEANRKFVLLNSQASYLFSKLSPVDQLRETLLAHNGPEGHQVKAFFSMHKPEEACVSCLILACSQQNQAQLQVSHWATQAFFLHGGEPTTSGHADQQIFPRHGGIQGGASHQYPFDPRSPHSAAHHAGLGMASTPNLTSTVVTFSPKHKAICLYLSRILRPIWEAKLFSTFENKTRKDKGLLLNFNIRSEELNIYLEQLTGLKTFMSQNSHITSHIAKDSAYKQSSFIGHDLSMDHQSSIHGDMLLQEKNSLQCVYELLSLVCELIALLQILCYHQFHLIAAALSQDDQKTLHNSTIRSLLTDHRQITEALIQCLIKQYLNDNAATDAISTRLLDVCPSFYSPQDAVCSKANEILENAKNSTNSAEKARLLKEALKMYKEICLQLELSSVCSNFSSVHFYIGIVDLTLARARCVDEQDLGVMHYKHGESPDDINGRQMYIARMECYKYITDVLSYLMACSHADTPNLTTDQAAQHLKGVLEAALQSTDHLFHVALYDWLIQKNLNEKLLEIQSLYMEDYLKRRCKSHPQCLMTIDLLWNYYEKTSNHLPAAQVLAKLADSSSHDLSLLKRIEYLSRAAMNAKSCYDSDGRLLDDLEEKLDVARLQTQIYEKLEGRKDDPHVQALNTRLMDITTLYGEYAEAYDLPECRLAIIHGASHYDPSLVENLWTDIFNKVFLETAELSVDTKMSRLSSKILALGRTYQSSDRYFPLAFIIKTLEQQCCLHQFTHSFVYTTLMKLDVSIDKLIEIYDRLFKQKDSFWQAYHQPYHLLYVMSDMLTTFLSCSSQMATAHRRQLTTRCLDNVAHYLVDLQASSATDGQVTELISQYKNIQLQLEQL